MGTFCVPVPTAPLDRSKRALRFARHKPRDLGSNFRRFFVLLLGATRSSAR